MLQIPYRTNERKIICSDNFTPQFIIILLNVLKFCHLCTSLTNNKVVEIPFYSDSEKRYQESCLSNSDYTNNNILVNEITFPATSTK